MTMLSLGEAARLIPGATVHGDRAATFERVSTDSRTVGPGDLFVALKGERFDAHDFLGDVAARGAAAALVAHVPTGLPIPAIEGGETRAALGALAHGWRKRFALPLIAVTGSNGKTTVKEMIASILAAAVGADARLATAGNLNNDIGVPLTLLRLSGAHRVAVIELGMNHPGETEVLARIAAPTVALVNNAQREHQEFMATVEAVALEHAAVIHALTPDGVAVFPADDAYAGIWRVAATGNRILDFALHDADRQADAQVTGRLHGGELAIDTPSGALTVRLRALGEHNARNALAATAAALAAGIELAAIKQGLESFEPVKGRLQVKQANVGSLAGATVVDDTYNANPDSMRAAIDVLAAQPAPRVLVIGDMGEVGDEGPAFHREIGAYARERGIDALFALGDASRDACTAYGDRARHFDDVGALVTALLAAGHDAHATVLVKGSRYMKMERVVDALTNQPATGMAPAAH
ncbi:UDP-N-acetylmuramoyl-tripeptide--D-alanyl-D-alanine ligase [Burkholderia sp. AU19243]|uniref:UDP-N-acetylmuramoyl-tripeptide--D-alanyl-D- alanine ligase n=1 Tax=Burkholderia TaxID=32008 RepID=UPI001AE882A0|nr:MULTISPECIES: UDP-N-acetylmuramoyl-tripeptide--D-alanyl-D-alanine ligase [Burkholderia]MBR8143649.1 UDP-N-acetylmuramoyl-tripeptide--D-alanyl-D-alanine ligase [Burkholderia vietnamiensis]MBR8365626.1 UDP-N-acetylmuramoyl-tripeptide--D-alanyl-D-alanine ligase [Burkholderia sp. AU19243]QTO43780.1 UDP-N-acetylmuramoyl-tripeptide--D-alanyl-D-alanine ligase [Burkholderia latens]QTO48812.1 UDP-N-acetylmuramoyl-tripeptide--D-alanyl-D-alanine ligase [Burkholderia latens]